MLTPLAFTAPALCQVHFGRQRIVECHDLAFNGRARAQMRRHAARLGLLLQSRIDLRNNILEQMREDGRKSERENT